MKSRSHQHCTPKTPHQCPYQVLTPYTLQFLRYSPNKCFRAARPPRHLPAHPDTMCENNTPTAPKGCGVKIMMHTYNPQGCPYQLSISYNLWFQRYCPDKILKVKVTMATSKVKLRSHHDVTHLHPLTNALPSINFLHLTVSEI